jgi:two-component system, NarL family, sensor kinase
MRGQIFELHPYVLDHAGLAAALRAIADRFAARMDAEITIAVDPAAAGHHDELIVVLGREVLANAAKHSAAPRRSSPGTSASHRASSESAPPAAS